MPRLRKQRAHPQTIAQILPIVDFLNRVAQGASRAEDRRRLDADETNMLALQLEQMRSRVYEAHYEPVKAREFFPVSNEIDTGADSFAYEETDEVGEMKPIRNLTDDFPSVETKGAKITHGIISLGGEYTYSIQDMRRAAFSGKPLEARKAMAAKRAWDRGLDEMVSLGSSVDGITGVLSRTVGSGAQQIRGTAMTSADWLAASLDPAGMLDDLNQAVKEMVVDSGETQMPTNLLLPTDAFLTASQTKMGDYDSRSVLEAFRAMNPSIQSVDPWLRLTTIDGTSGNNARGLLYKKDPEVVEIMIPQEYEVFPPQVKNLGFKVLCHGRTAGGIVYRPLGLRYLTALPVDSTP